MNKKDQTTIDHVASVSKHPHAAMIVKWLITGWDVVYYSTASTAWLPVLAQSPIWDKNTEYRLVEPKPAKPAYRVYRDKGCTITYTQDRDANGTVSTVWVCCEDNIEWLTDWIEYNNCWPTALVERIAAIDIKAAEWIVDHWDDLLEDRYRSAVSVGRESNELFSMFRWASSEQGINYWSNISRQLGENN